MIQIPDETLLIIQRHFHSLILKRAGAFIEEHNTALPELAPLLTSQERQTWFPIPGMYGGFNYWLEGEGEQSRLVTESWSRVAEGSGQRHEITVDGTRLVEVGFV